MKDHVNCRVLFVPSEMINGTKGLDSSGSLFKIKGNYRCQPIIMRTTRDARLSNKVAGKWTCAGSR